MNYKTNAKSTDQSYSSEFAKHFGNDVRAFSFWKARVALHAILQALDIGQGDEVILPGYTCVVVPNVLRLIGAKPVYVDIDPLTYNLNPDQTAQSVTSRTKAIIVQHTYGIPGPVEEVSNIAKKQGLFVIEDAAHVFGSSHKGKKLGLLGDAAFFSSQWSKPYTTGLGGLAITKNPDFADKMEKVCRQFIQPPFRARLKLAIQYQVFQNFYSPKIYFSAQRALHILSRLGLFVASSSDSELEGEFPLDHRWLMGSNQSRNGLIKLKTIIGDLENRKKIKEYYMDALNNASWRLTEIPDDVNLLRFPLRVGNKIQLIEIARQSRVELGSWFETPLHPVPLEKHEIFGYTLGSCPNSEQAARETINLPMHELITTKEAERTLEFVKKYAIHPNV